MISQSTTAARGRNPIIEVLVSDRVGGAGVIAIEVARRLRDLGRNVRAMVPGDGTASAALVGYGVPVTTYNKQLLTSHSAFDALAGNFRLGISLRVWRKNLVHFHGPAVYGAARHCLGRSIDVVHIQIEEGHELLQWAFQRPPRLIVTCARFLEPSVRRALPRQLQERQRIEAVPNAVDVDRFASCRGVDRRGAKQAIGAPPNRPLILMTANLAPHKGQETAIRAISRLKALGVCVSCWFAGEDREHSGYDRQLERLAAEEGVADRVKLLGFRSDVDRLYAAADVLLLPSTHEGLPLTILEAQSAGVPVLAAPTAGVPEVIEDGKTGWLIQANDVENYAQRIKAVVENRQLHQRVADQAFDFVRRNHNWDNYCNRMIELYDSLL